MEKNIQSQNNNKKQLSMAALMFFSPLVQNLLKKNTLGLSTQETRFIKGYVRLGYFSLIFLILSTITGVASYQIMTSDILATLYTISIIITLIILVIGTLGIVTDTSILSGDKKLIDIYQENITTNKKEIMISYFPLYNIYLRYKEHNFENPNLLVKESILSRIIFCIVAASTTPFWASIILILIIIRIASLLGGIDIIKPEIKKFINTTFKKNPEELRGYIRGPIIFIYLHYFKQSPITMQETITQTKEDFSLLYNVQTHNSIHIKIQYLLLIITGIVWIVYGKPDFSLRTTTLATIIVGGRYLIMLIKRNHLPALPLFKEITDQILYLLNKNK